MANILPMHTNINEKRLECDDVHIYIYSPKIGILCICFFMVKATYKIILFIMSSDLGASPACHCVICPIIGPIGPINPIMCFAHVCFAHDHLHTIIPNIYMCICNIYIYVNMPMLRNLHPLNSWPPSAHPRKDEHRCLYGICYSPMPHLLIDAWTCIDTLLILQEKAVPTLATVCLATIDLVRGPYRHRHSTTPNARA